MSVNRQLWVVVHRWAGLTIALFTLIVGLTGAIIPWQGELERMIAPERFVAAPAPGVRPLPIMELRRIAEARTGGVIDYVALDRDPDEPASFSVAASPGRPALAFNEILLDPYSGREMARDRSADLTDGKAQIVPFLYRLHFSLALGDWGGWVLGVAAAIWTVDCFVGFYLALPAARRDWWRRWGQSWRVRWRAAGYRLNFDLHRAGSLWIWPMLLVFAWSSVGMNLRSVYDPVMSLLPDYHRDPPQRPRGGDAFRRLDIEQALAVARTTAQREAARRGLHIERERVISYDAAENSYSYAVRTERDRSDDGANSYFEIDGSTGALLRVALPTGEHSGNTIDYWLGELHVAGVFGLPYRILVSVIGVLIAVVTVTGVIMWLKKRHARSVARRRRRFGSRISGAYSPPTADDRPPVGRRGARA